MTVGPLADGSRGVAASSTSAARGGSAWLRRPSASGVALAFALVNLVAEATAFTLALTHGMHPDLAKSDAWLNPVAGPAFPAIGALLLRRSDQAGHDSRTGERRLGWLLVGFGTLCAATLWLHVVTQLALDAAGAPPYATGTLGLVWFSSWLWTGVAPGLLLLLLLFPTGHAPGPRWSWAPAGIGVVYGGMTLAVALAPGPITDYAQHPENPLGLHAAHGALAVVSVVGFGGLAVAAVVTLAAVVWRFYRGDPAVRRQLRWLLVGVLVLAGTVVVPQPHGTLAWVSVAMNVAAVLLLPLTLAVTLVRRDGRALGLPRLLVFGLLSVLLMATYLLLVGAAQVVLGDRADRGAALVAAGVVAVLAAPLRTRLQRAVDRLAYGERGDPYTALSDLGRRIAGDPGDLLAQVTDAVSAALRTPYVAVVLSGEEAPAAVTDRRLARATAGDATRPHVEESLPLTVAGEQVGTLLVGGRTDGRRYGRRDRALLLDLSRHIAVAAHSAALSRDLLRSRESLVTAREEERRRIRRDLHDGLGPALAGVALGLDAARNTVARDPDETAAVLAELKGEVQSSLADVRRLVYDLRPPALDQLGLVAALEEQAARMRERGGPRATVAADRLPLLPAAVEVAAYRIATEALSNAARHARARVVSVRLTLEPSCLEVEVRDDGDGLPAPARRRAGVGLAAMTERAEELGGTCTVGPGDPRGTVVRAALPLRGES